jgi:hypothetical protein
MRTLNVSFALGGIAFALSTQLGGCNAVSDDCSTYETCPAGSNAGSGGSNPNAGAETGGSASGKGGTMGTSGEGGDIAGGSSGASGGGGSEAGAGGTATVPACNGECPSDKPVCEEATDTCVQCLIPADCRTGLKTRCDTASNSCVECLAPTDCADAKAARCDKGTCAKCTTNDDCAHIDGKDVCDTKASECVECTISDESACAGNACNPATRACTNTPVGTVGPCEPCVADSECIGGNKPEPDSRCVPMEFNGSPRSGGFCLRRVAKTCSKPFQTPLSAVSLSGATAESYCAIDQTTVRCEAVLDLVGGAQCTDGSDTSCGCARDQDGECTGTGQGGLCRMVGVNVNRCTYGCATTADCPGSLKCTLANPYCH